LYLSLELKEYGFENNNSLSLGKKMLWRDKYLKFVNRLISNKKRAISPVIAVVLLIGLAVAAAAAIFIVVLPLLQPTVSLEITDAYVIYDHEYTKNVDEGKGYGMGYVEVANVGTGEVEISDIKIYYATSFAAQWIELVDAVNLENITSTVPCVVGFSPQDVLRIRFVNPEGSDNNTLVYKIVVTPSEGRNLDTTRSEIVDESEMQLSPDRPDISYTRTLGTIRRDLTISPSSVRDNSDVKNVTYEIFDASSTLVRTKTIISETSWPWQWITYNYSAEGLDNGSYSMKMTVYDFAGLSDFVDDIDFTIDNDYMSPNIVSVTGSSTKGGEGTAEVGEFYSVTATITDSGSADSSVSSAYIFYKTNSSSDTTYAATLMTKSTGNTWIGNIPAPFIDSEALANNLAFNISAIDADTNEIRTDFNYANVEDTTEPDFTQHVFEGETITSQTTLEATEGLTLSLSVTVDDKDFVRDVKLYWRERNETGISPQYGPWQITNNISGTGNTWDFRIPAINVTIDGLDYYFNATDPTNNTALEGSSDSPYTINIPDEINPTINVLSTIPSYITEGTDLHVSASISDNDPSFSYTDYETGTVKLGYRKPGDSVFTYLDMTHTSGDSSQGETSIWEGTIRGGNFSIAASPVIVEVLATDDSGKSNLIDYSIDVSPAGTPLLVYVADSVSVSGGSDHILSFNVKNDAGGTQPATANISHIQVELRSNDKTITSGEPYIIQIEEAGTIWQNSTNTEGENNTKLELDSAFLFAKDATKTFTLTYANSSGGYYDLNDLTVNVTIFYSYGPTYVNPGDDTLESFNTPVTQLIPQTETRYLLSGTATVNSRTGYQLGTSYLGSIHLFDGTATYTGDLSAQWGIRVYILHSDSSFTEITMGSWVATVSRPSGGDDASIQYNFWSCPETSLATTDAIWIEFWVQVGSNSPEIHANLVTEVLGAEQLDASTWGVYYYTERDRSGGFFSRRTTAYLHWGDGVYNSRIENFKYSSVGGGGGSSIVYSIISNGASPTEKSLMNWNLLDTLYYNELKTNCFQKMTRICTYKRSIFWN
jgi:hypothetical protein